MGTIIRLIIFQIHFTILLDAFDWKKKGQGVTKVIGNHSLGTMIIQTKSDGGWANTF